MLIDFGAVPRRDCLLIHIPSILEAVQNVHLALASLVCLSTVFLMPQHKVTNVLP